MKKYGVLSAMIALVLASLACQSLSGGGDSGAPELPPVNGGGVESPTAENGDSGGNATGVESDFPLPDGATNIQELGGSTNFQVKMSLDEAMKFYMEVFTSKGYTERAILTVTSETTFSMVFDGHESGKAIVVQGVDMGDGAVNINIRLEDN
jgi:hypothetical protein